MSVFLRLPERRAVLIAVDLVIVNLMTLLALWIMAARAGWEFDRVYLVDQAGWFAFLSILWLSFAFLNGFYDPQKMVDLSQAASALLRSVAMVVIVYLLIYFFLATPGWLPRGIVFYQGISSFILIGLWRVAYALLLQQPAFARRAIIVGAGWAGQTIATAIFQHAPAYYHVLGFVDDDPELQGKTVALKDASVRLPILGAARDLARLVRENRVPEVILAISHNVSAPLFQAILDCQEQGAQITLMPVLFEQLAGRVPIEHIGEYWNVALPRESAEAGGLYPIAKRVFDIVGALIGLALYLPLLLIIAPALYLDSRGPIFYSQERVGKGGKVFKLLKLRTMVADAEMNGHAVRAQANDPRITRVGRWLRKMRLDEMPQLINILKGDMSAVGPRPERPEHLAELEQAIPFHRLRNAVKPGMAGWAVVNYDYVDSIEDARIRLEYDLYYIKHQSIWLDLLILFRTMGHMLMLRGR
jgi:exopolysaccharide biosynthesis polyprenyl glycosylphosphotransferase